MNVSLGKSGDLISANASGGRCARATAPRGMPGTILVKDEILRFAWSSGCFKKNRKFSTSNGIICIDTGKHGHVRQCQEKRKPMVNPKIPASHDVTRTTLAVPIHRHPHRRQLLGGPPLSHVVHLGHDDRCGHLAGPAAHPGQALGQTRTCRGGDDRVADAGPGCAALARHRHHHRES